MMKKWSSRRSIRLFVISYFALLFVGTTHAKEAFEEALSKNAIVAINTATSATHVTLKITLKHRTSVMPPHFFTAHPARIIVDLLDTDNATGIRRDDLTWPSGSRASVLHSFAIAQTAQRTRVVLHLTTSMPYEVDRDANTLIINIALPATEPPGNQNNDLPSTNNTPISLNFQKIEVRALLQLFADFTGINIVASDSVTGSVTLRLKDVPWQQALDVVLQARALRMQRYGQVIWIAPRSELLAKEKNELEQRSQIAALEPLHTEVFQLNYQKADAFRKLLDVGPNADDQKQAHALSRRGSTMIDQRTNQLFVTDTRSVLDMVRKLLAQVDIPSRQVEIEARIVEADHAFSRALGVRLGLSSGTQQLGGNDNQANNESNTSSGVHAGRVALSLFGAGANRILDIELSALETNGKGQILASPRVVTANQQAALIEQGEEIPYQQSTSSGATSIAFKKANLKLEVTPQITPDGNVILSVDISKDSRGVATEGGLAINTKHVKTQVQVENGGTVVIGGIYTQTETDMVSKVPLLGDLPLLGYLFKSTEKIRNKTELLIFLTPKIVADGHF